MSPSRGSLSYSLRRAGLVLLFALAPILAPISALAAVGPEFIASKTNNDSDSTVQVGDPPFIWDVRVSNTGATGTFTSGQTILTDDLPSGPTYGEPDVITFGTVTGDIDCSIASDTLTCTPLGASTVIDSFGGFDVRFTVAPVAPGTLFNPDSGGTCAVDPLDVLDEGDDVGNNRCANAVTVLAEGPNLTVSKSHDPVDDEVDIGETFQWTIVVENVGNDDASFGSNEIVLRDDLPVGPNYFNLTEDGADITCDITSNVLTCRTGAAQAIPPGGQPHRDV